MDTRLSILKSILLLDVILAPGRTRTDRVRDEMSCGVTDREGINSKGDRMGNVTRLRWGRRWLGYTRTSED